MSLFPFTYALACWPEGPTFYQHPNAKEPSLRLRSRGIRGHAAAIARHLLRICDTNACCLLPGIERKPVAEWLTAHEFVSLSATL